MFHNVQYVNTLQSDLTIQSVEVSSPYLGFQYPSAVLHYDPMKPNAPFFFGTLSYDPAEEYKACNTLLCNVVPGKHIYPSSLDLVPMTASSGMLHRRVKQKNYYEKVRNNYELETLM